MIPLLLLRASIALILLLGACRNKPVIPEYAGSAESVQIVKDRSDFQARTAKNKVILDHLPVGSRINASLAKTQEGAVWMCVGCGTFPTDSEVWFPVTKTKSGWRSEWPQWVVKRASSGTGRDSILEDLGWVRITEWP